MAESGLQAPFVLANSDIRFTSIEHQSTAGIAPGAIFTEPEGRKIAPGIPLAAV